MNKHCVVVYWCIIDILMEVMKLTHHLKYAMLLLEIGHLLGQL